MGRDFSFKHKRRRPTFRTLNPNKPLNSKMHSQQHLHKKRNSIHSRIEAEKARHDGLARIAQDTMSIILTTQSYIVEGSSATHLIGESHDLSTQIKHSREGTSFYPHHSAFLADWQSGPKLMKAHHPTQITFVASSTLSATRQLWEKQAQATSPDNSGGSSIGVLNFASPKKPGSACLSGGDSHEDRIMRQTTLYDSLQNSAAGAQFYNAHRSESDGSGLHDHAMLYSPGVTVFKDDEGQTIPPYAIHVVSSVPVHAGTVHAKFNIEDAEANEGIRTVMKERMARMLRLFEERENRVLVLGAFGVGQSCNSADMIAEIWADLLAVNNAKFRDVFDKIVFAVPGKHLNAFENAFQGRCLESELLSE